jgi:hypothetical protein
MQMFYPFETQVAPLINVRRERLLPSLGEVVVQIGERVEPTQVIARANLPGDFRVVAVASKLGVSFARAKKYMRVKVGDNIRRGQIIAQKGSNQVKSPIAGILASSSGGRVLVEMPPTPFELRAYIPGAVTNVLHNQGVIIETTGAVIQGTWGAGGESFGILKKVVRGPDRTLRARDIDPACHGSIVIGGSGLNESVLERAQELQVRGIVTGGLPAELIPQIRRSPIPIVATEGIGTIPMSPPIFQLLTTNDGREAAISGQIKSRWGSTRPEIVIPLPAESLPTTQSQPGTPLAVGAQVRIVRAPYTGQVGTIVSITEHPRRIETDAKVLGAEVDLGETGPVFVPLVNLEVLR